jgi:hypothetical protein
LLSAPFERKIYGSTASIGKRILCLVKCFGLP